MKPLFSVLVLLLLAAAAEADTPVAVDRVIVTITGPCTIRSPVFLVLNGAENASFQLVHKGEAWEGFWPGRKRNETFDATRASASLRLGGMRTGCERAVVGKDSNGKYVATFEFRCDKSPVRVIEIAPDPELDISYARITRAAYGDCVESAWHPDFFTIEDVWKRETVLLQLNRKTADRMPPVLLLDELQRRKSPLGLTDLAEVLRSQRSKPVGVLPTNSSAAADNPFALPRDLKLSVKVQ